MGRVPLCTCGTVKLWHGVVNSAENSQHISEVHFLAHHPRVSVLRAALAVGAATAGGLAFVLAVLLEATWEVFENTPFVINRYRAATIALDTTATAS